MDALSRITSEEVPAGKEPSEALMTAISQVAQDLGNAFRQDCVSIVNELLGEEDYEVVAAAYEDVKSTDADLATVFDAVERHTREEHGDVVEKWTLEYNQ